MLWGSNDVIKSFTRYTKYQLENGNSPVALFYFENFLFSIRKDLGHSVQSHKPGDLLRLYVDNIDEEMEKHRQNKDFNEDEIYDQL